MKLSKIPRYFIILFHWKFFLTSPPVCSTLRAINVKQLHGETWMQISRQVSTAKQVSQSHRWNNGWLLIHVSLICCRRRWVVDFAQVHWFLVPVSQQITPQHSPYLYSLHLRGCISQRVFQTSRAMTTAICVIYYLCSPTKYLKIYHKTVVTLS